jgi:hypothetical protein
VERGAFDGLQAPCCMAGTGRAAACGQATCEGAREPQPPRVSSSIPDRAWAALRSPPRMQADKRRITATGGAPTASSRIGLAPARLHPTIGVLFGTLQLRLSESWDGQASHVAEFPSGDVDRLPGRDHSAIRPTKLRSRPPRSFVFQSSQSKQFRGRLRSRSLPPTYCFLTLLLGADLSVAAMPAIRESLSKAEVTGAPHVKCIGSALALRLPPLLLVSFFVGAWPATATPASPVSENPGDIARFSFIAGSFTIANNIVPRLESHALDLLSIPAAKPTVYQEVSSRVNSADLQDWIGVQSSFLRE